MQLDNINKPKKLITILSFFGSEIFQIDWRIN
jgi:hypothetical protein